MEKPHCRFPATVALAESNDRIHNWLLPSCPVAANSHSLPIRRKRHGAKVGREGKGGCFGRQDRRTHYSLPGRCFAKMDQRQRGIEGGSTVQLWPARRAKAKEARCRQQRRIFFKEKRDSVADVAEAAAGVFFEAAAEQAADADRGVGRECGEVGLALDDGGKGVDHAVATKGGAAGEHLVEDAAKGPEVRALIDGLAAGLLGTHVGGGAEDHSDFGGVEVDGFPLVERDGAVGFAGVAGDRLGEAKVEYLDDGLGGDLYVGRLERPRWTTPLQWAASSASAIWPAMRSVSLRGMGPKRRRSARVSPSTSSRMSAWRSPSVSKP